MAVLENQNVLYQEKNPKADLIGWAGKEGDERKKAQENPALLNDPILDLFGSLYKRGRIHFTDAYCDESDKINEQKRAHVAVDRGEPSLEHCSLTRFLLAMLCSV